MDAYEVRDKLLHTMGFTNYSHYLGGESWKRIRRAVLSLTPLCCCGRAAVQIHHRNYDLQTLLGQDLSALVPVCGPCHRKIELTRSGAKRSFTEAQKRYDELRANQAGRRTARSGSKSCKRCGNKPRKGADFCRLCIRFRRYGRERYDSKLRPLCQGRDCTHQAATNSDYCRIHQIDPDYSLKDYLKACQRARRKIPPALGRARR